MTEAEKVLSPKIVDGESGFATAPKGYGKIMAQLDFLIKYEGDNLKRRALHGIKDWIQKNAGGMADGKQ